MSSFDPSHLCSPGWTVQSRNASWFRMKLGGWLYCLQNQNIRVLSMFFSHPTKERGRKSHRGCTPQIWGAYFLKEKVLVAQSCLTLFDPMDYSLPGSSLHGILQARILDWGAISTSRGFPNPGIESRSPALQADSLSSEPWGKPMMSLYAYDIIIPKLEYIIYLCYYTIHKNPATCNSYSLYF